MPLGKAGPGPEYICPHKCPLLLTPLGRGGSALLSSTAPDHLEEPEPGVGSAIRATTFLSLRETPRGRETSREGTQTAQLTAWERRVYVDPSRRSWPTVGPWAKPRPPLAFIPRFITTQVYWFRDYLRLLSRRNRRGELPQTVTLFGPLTGKPHRQLLTSKSLSTWCAPDRIQQ